MKLYKIVNKISLGVYIGITRTDPKARWRSHLFTYRSGKKHPLYDAMRSYGVENFELEVIGEFTDLDALCVAERMFIAQARRSELTCYNICDGGLQNWNHVRVDREQWIANLKVKRAGRKPALGMKHTDENKEKFSEFGKQRWDKYGRYPSEVTDLSPKAAKDKYGIIRTHHYRLRKLAENNDLS